MAVNCSARKTADPISSLRARSLPRGAPGDLAEEWRARRARAGGEIAARRLYAGRAFSLAYGIANSMGGQLRVISAGMGLLSPDTAISPYSLTLSPGSPDCILQRAPRGETFSAEQWWQAIRARAQGCSPFARLLAAHPQGLLLIAMTRPYLAMVVNELKCLDGSARERIRIVGLTQTQFLPADLRHCAMPYDARLDDVASDLRGTTYDYPVRALAHFTTLIKLDRRIESAVSHARRVRQSLAHWTAPRRAIRNRIDDSMLNRIIRTLKASGSSRTAALQHLRVGMRLACEQTRFAIAWDQS